MLLPCDLDTESKYDNPYDSEVRLIDGGTGFTSSGVAEVYLNGQWGTICSDAMSSASADTICRQMGYTESATYTNTPSEYVLLLHSFASSLSKI